MRLDCDRFRRWRDRRYARQVSNDLALCIWHSWFAWHPVRLGEADCRWLERVKRRRVWADTAIFGPVADWEYR